MGSFARTLFLEHFCLDQFSVIQGQFYLKRFSNTSFDRTLLGSNFSRGTNVHFSNVHFVLRQIFGLKHRTPPPLPCLLSPPLLSIASTLGELKWAITSPKKGQPMQRCHEEQSARSKGARLSPLEFWGPLARTNFRVSKGGFL